MSASEPLDEVLCRGAYPLGYTSRKVGGQSKLRRTRFAFLAVPVKSAAVANFTDICKVLFAFMLKKCTFKLSCALDEFFGKDTPREG